LVNNVFFIPYNSSIDPEPRGNDNSETDVEANLDVQWITGMNAGLKTSIYHIPSLPLPYLGLLSSLQSSTNLPSTFSLSYSSSEQYENGKSEDEMNHANELFVAFGLLGVTFVVASGDNGAYSSGHLETKCDAFSPSFPASSPYVTSVGSTQLINLSMEPHVLDIREVVASLVSGAGFTSGSGLSSVFPRPDYQKKAVKFYFKRDSCGTKAIPSSYLSDNETRSYPDVSIIGYKYGVVNFGKSDFTGGTSASSPTFASFISRFNDLRMKANLPRLGFINPLLYDASSKNVHAFNDIDFGDNKCTTQSCCSVGFKACERYNIPVGLGSPNFHVLGDILLKAGEGNDPIKPTTPGLSLLSIVLTSAAAIFSFALLASFFVYYLRQPARSEKEVKIDGALGYYQIHTE
jgi:tripeptidyl-peptidase-1